MSRMGEARLCWMRSWQAYLCTQVHLVTTIFTTAFRTTVKVTNNRLMRNQQVLLIFMLNPATVTVTRKMIISICRTLDNPMLGRRRPCFWTRGVSNVDFLRPRINATPDSAGGPLIPRSTTRAASQPRWDSTDLPSR